MESLRLGDINSEVMVTEGDYEMAVVVGDKAVLGCSLNLYYY